MIFFFYQCDLSCGNDVVLCAEVNAVLGLLHPANHGARKVDPPAYIDTLNVCRLFYIKLVKGSYVDVSCEKEKELLLLYSSCIIKN